MRIIAGTHRGHRLVAPPSGTRPTSDRVREALFSALEARTDLQDAVVLDLFAGSGALGLEAMSRGAGRLLAVDSARAAVSVLRGNAARLGVSVEVHTVPVATFLARTPPVAADLVLLDPPYDYDGVGEVLALLPPWVTPGGIVVLERSSRSADPVFPPTLGVVGERRYGETTLWLARRELTGD